jgi:hypothetical protein
LEPRDKTGATTINQAFFLEWTEFLWGLEQNRRTILSPSASDVTARLIDDLLSGNNTGARK